MSLRLLRYPFSRYLTILSALLVVLAGSLVFAARGESVARPVVDPQAGQHLGVASCAGSTCHGRQEPTGVVVRQDELLRWQDGSSPAGAHSRAWRVLGAPRGRAIAARLGIGDPQTSAQCLGCHADPAPEHGPRFQIGDGVGCEGCHGGASTWLATHYAVGTTHARSVALGLRPLDRAAVRADTCLDCHFGSSKPGQFVDHRIMAAGHPRIAFELDLFSTLTQHWNADADYARRKQAPSSVTLWAVGQARALSRALTLYAIPKFGQRGSFPEFYFFDCQTCHRRISDAPDDRPSAPANPGRPIPLGTPAFQDENMILLAAAAGVAANDLAGRLDTDSRAFHAALAQDRSSAVLAANRLRGTADALAERFATAPLGRSETFAMVDRVAHGALIERFTDYEGSVQAVMAVDTLLSALVRQGAVGDGAAAGVRGEINRAYAAVRDPNAYQPAAFRTALRKATGAIGALR
jgi:hypothetical protein